MIYSLILLSLVYFVIQKTINKKHNNKYVIINALIYHYMKHYGSMCFECQVYHFISHICNYEL